MRLWERYKDVIVANWHVGFTAFGGPAVQFQTFHERFVTHLQWIDEPMYQQIFAISQALPGSASMKMLFCINTVHSGFAGGTIAFLLFCLPGAIGMYGLSVGVAHIGHTLPSPVYALLSGLNAATVGIIALAAVRLSERAISDKITRFLVYLGAVMGMLYTALWYYPVLMAGAGLTTLIWDGGYLQRLKTSCFEAWKRRQRRRRRRKNRDEEDIRIREKIVADLERGYGHGYPGTENSNSSSLRSSQESSWIPIPPSTAYPKRELVFSLTAFCDPRPPPTPPSSPSSLTSTPTKDNATPPLTSPATSTTSNALGRITWPIGTAIIALFLLSFAATLTLRSLLRSPPRIFSLFSSLYLAGTIIFGGGPVVIPLLREYIVAPGWVSPRDFLLGLAVIQAFPGPNFNFAVYLGSLALKGTGAPSYVGAGIAFVGMYGPGVFIMVGFMGLWRILSERGWFLAVLRGVNAAAVGLVFTAVYKLWQLGDLTAAVQGGSPLGTDPWLVAITGTAFVGGAWFGVSPPAAILLGGAMGVARWAIFMR